MTDAISWHMWDFESNTSPVEGETTCKRIRLHLGNMELRPCTAFREFSFVFSWPCQVCLANPFLVWVGFDDGSMRLVDRTMAFS